MGVLKNTHPLHVTLKNDSEENTNNNTRVIPLCANEGKTIVVEF